MSLRNAFDAALRLGAMLLVRGGLRVDESVGGAGAPAPTVVSADPDVGDTTATHAGLMTITGTDFVAGATVAIGGTAATDVTVVNATTITCRPPAKASGQHNIVVTNPDTQLGELANGYRAWTPAEITGVDLYWDSRKNLVNSGTTITTWNGIAPAGSTLPTLIADVFGTGVPAVRFAPSGYFDLGAWRQLATGASRFAVAKHTSTDTTWDAYEGNAPLTLFGDRSGNVSTGMGFSGDELEMTQYAGSWLRAARGASLGDGTTWLVGWTHETSGDAKAYVGETQQGSTASLAYDTTFNGYDTLGAGYSAGDGFDGDVGAFIVATGALSSTDRTRLHKWSRLSFGAAA